jgi:hypothetical protein
MPKQAMFEILTYQGGFPVLARSSSQFARCECMHLIKMNCLALRLDESAHASLAASCEELRARTGNPPSDIVKQQIRAQFSSMGSKMVYTLKISKHCK